MGFTVFFFSENSHIFRFKVADKQRDVIYVAPGALSMSNGPFGCFT